MAIKVPTYGGQKVQEQPTPVLQRNSNAPIEAFGGGAAVEQRMKSAQQIGGAVQGVSESAQQIFLQARNQADAALVQDRDNKTQIIKDKYTERFKQLKGLDATKQLDAMRAEMEAEIHKDDANYTERQNTLFNRFASQQVNDWDRLATTHASSEMNSFSINSSASSQINKIANASELGASQETIDINKGQGLAATESLLAAKYGVHVDDDWKAESPEAQAIADRVKLDFTTSLHMGVVESKLKSGNPRDAEAYANRWRSEIDPDKFPNFQGAIKNTKISQQASDWVKAHLNKYDMGAGLREINKIGNAELRDATEREWSKWKTLLDKTTEANDNAKRSDQVMRVFQNGIESIPHFELQSMDDTQRKNLQQVDRMRLGVEKIKPDEQVYSKYSTMPIGQLSNMTEGDLITKVMGHVTPDQYKQISDRWALGRDKQGDVKVKQLESSDSLLFNSLFLNGFFQNGKISMRTISKSKKDSQIWAQAQMELNNRYVAAQTQNPGKPVDTGKLVNDLVKDMNELRTRGTGPKPRTTPKPIVDVSPSAIQTPSPNRPIPAQYAGEIDAELRRRGVALTDQNRLKLWQNSPLSKQ